MKRIRISIIFVLSVVFFSCTRVQDVEQFEGIYKGTYHGIKRIYVGLVPTESSIEGEETFTIKKGIEDNTVVICMDEREIVGTVRGNKVVFENYFINSVDSTLTINETYKMTGKLKNGNTFSYVTVIEGTAVDETNYAYRLDGYYEGKAIKQ